MSSGMNTVHKDVSLISLVPKWSGGENATPLVEFLASIERAALLGIWQERVCMNIAVLQLADPAKAFRNASTEFYTNDASWQDFKCAFRERLRTYIATSNTSRNYKRLDKLEMNGLWNLQIAAKS